MTNEIEQRSWFTGESTPLHLIKISTLRDVQIKLKEAQLEGFVIPELVFEIIKNLEESYNQK